MKHFSFVLKCKTSQFATKVNLQSPVDCSRNETAIWKRDFKFTFQF